MFFLSSATYSAEHILDAASWGNLAGVKAAIARGEDKDTKSSAPFFVDGSVASVGFNKEGVLSYQQDAEWTALIHAAFNGYTNVVNYLLQIGAEPNVVDYNGVTALMYAIVKNDMKTAQIFVNYPKAINFREPRFSMMPLMWAMIHGDTNIVKLLLSKTTDVDTKDKDGWTALHYAVIHGRKDCVRTLVTHKANINAQDNDGKTPLMRASENGEEQIVRHLVENGAEVYKRNKEGKTALDYSKGKIGLKGLKIERIDKNTVLITDGFVYQRNMRVSFRQTIRITDIQGGKIRAKGAVLMGAESAVGSTWIFNKPGIVLHNGDYIYTSKLKDASIQFFQEGVVLKGFSIENPNEEGIKRVIAILQKKP